MGEERDVIANLVGPLSCPLPEDIEKLKRAGYFGLALELIDMRLTKSLPAMLRERLILEKTLIAVYQKDYCFTKQEALDKMRGRIEGFTEAEFDLLWKEGFIDWHFVEGEMKFLRSFADNVIKTRPDVAARQIDPAPDHSKEMLDSVIAVMKKRGSAAFRLHITHSLTISPEAYRPGRQISAYIPLPMEAGMVEGFEILSLSGGGQASHPLGPARNAHFAAPSASTGHSFVADYTYLSRARYVTPKAEDALLASEQPDFETGELLPHIAFTPYLKDLAAEVAGGETNPVALARKCYDYVTTHVMYSYMRDYLAIENIQNFVSTSFKGDCGVQALFFISLCRALGIPARFHSGLFAAPWDIGCHDWAQFYIEPYGWLYADPSFGGAAYRAGAMERWDFYFGNLEPFRMAANCAFQAPFDPPMKYLRYDPYDSQLGEAEYDDGPIDRSYIHTDLKLEAVPIED